MGQRAYGTPGQGNPFFNLQRTLAVQGLATTIQHSSQKLGAGRRFTGPQGGYHPGVRCESLQVAGRHEVQALTGETHHFCLDGFRQRRLDHATAADGDLATHRLQGQAHHAGEFAFHRQRRCLRGAVQVGPQA